MLHETTIAGRQLIPLTLERTQTMKASTKPSDVNKALDRLLALMAVADAEFPDVAWRVASSLGVDYVTLCDAYDDYCAA
jgi:hypothetical protein